tara:strand:+ start:421 stop:1227 length:807 start_codon:yes stop_codon:yes gene_type:complete
MAKNKISEWSSTPALNTDVGGIDIAEGCAPSGINNAIREVMAQVKDQQSGTDADNFTVGGNLTVTGSTTLAAATGVTPITADNSTKVATTAYVKAITGTLGTMSSQNATSVAITGGTIAGITDLTVADGGTGQSTLAANAVLVGNGTSGINSVAPSTSGNVLTSNGTAWTSSSSPPSVGVGQTWQDVKASRAVGTAYTNITGKPIEVSASVYVGGNGSSLLQVDGINVQFMVNQFGDRNLNVTMSAIVPNGSTYNVTSGGINYWAELR